MRACFVTLWLPRFGLGPGVVLILSGFAFTTGRFVLHLTLLFGLVFFQSF